MLNLSFHQSKPSTISHSRINRQHQTAKPGFPISQIVFPAPPNKLTFTKNPLILIPRCAPQHPTSLVTTSLVDDDVKLGAENVQEKHKRGAEKNFWGAVTFIIGTAVGPGMLGLPAATIKSGPFTSTIAIFLCWVYVISSIILVAELNFAAMEEDGVDEVSFTGLATKAVGSGFGALVALVYASLSFSLLIACVSGIGSIVSQWFPWMNPVLGHALFPLVVGTVIGFFPFKVIDTWNRFLCFLMLFSITSLVAIGLSVARANVLGAFAPTSWTGSSSILPAIPVAVLTLGFHVITPFICKLAGDLSEARKAVLIGGSVPLVMVLSWNLLVLGLSRTNTAAASANDPISLLLSVDPSALSAVQGFAFSALATSLIGYAVSFPKQLLDTLELIFVREASKKQDYSPNQMLFKGDGSGRVGLVAYWGGNEVGYVGRTSFAGSRCSVTEEIEPPASMAKPNSLHNKFVMVLVLGVPILIGSFFPSTFSRALDFAGVYANCFLFGILPPVMAHIYSNQERSSGHPFYQEVISHFYCFLALQLFWGFGTREMASRGSSLQIQDRFQQFFPRRDA